MAYRLKAQQLEHDEVVRASARTYSEMQVGGHKVAINPGSEKNQSVGPGDNPRYPDVVVWKPESPISNKGTAVIIEEIETEDSVNDEEAEQWADYASLGIRKFILVVPKSKAPDAAAIADRKGIAITAIWYYFQEGGQIRFQKYR